MNEKKLCVLVQEFRNGLSFFYYSQTKSFRFFYIFIHSFFRLFPVFTRIIAFFEKKKNTKK